MPFMKAPETDPQFEVFFSKQWGELLVTSLGNFLATVFQHMRTYPCRWVVVQCAGLILCRSVANTAELQSRETVAEKS